MEALAFVRSGPACGLAPPACGSRQDSRGLTVRPYMGVPFYLKQNDGLFRSESWQAMATRESDSLAFGVRRWTYGQFLTVAMKFPFVRGGRVFASSARRYAVFETRQAFEAFVSRVPMALRAIEEQIFQATPHFFYLDIERSKFEAGAAEATIASMTRYLLDHFVGILAAFFSETFGLAMGREAILVTLSSDSKKFSAHVTVNDGVHYCASRVESWMVAALLARRLEALERTDAAFREWYVDGERVENGEGFQRVVDYRVYTSGTRNMRIIGATKVPGGGAALGAAWTDLRPLMPVQEGVDWARYLITCNDTAGKAPLRIDDALQSVVRDWCEDLRLRPREYVATCMRGLARYFANSSGRQIAAAQVRAPRAAQAGGSARTARLLQMIEAGDTGGRVSAEEFASLSARYFEVAQKMVEAMAKFLHPRQAFSFMEPNRARGELRRIQIDTFVDVEGVRAYRVDESGAHKRQRLCFWSYSAEHPGPCQGGGHRAEISVEADLSMHYFCHRCRIRGLLVLSPIQPFTVTPCVYNQTAPEGFEAGFFYYGGASFDDESDLDPRMREVQELPGGGLYDPDVQRTIVLHGGMGTGKSFQTNAFLSRAMREIEAKQGRPARVLSITFRTMLAASNAKTFGLQVYNQETLAGRPLTDENLIACQLDSLLRLCSPVGEQDGEATHRRARLYDIVIMDESESILSHLSSKTIADKRLAIFTIFKDLVRRANTLIAADADMDERTLSFLRRFRRLRHESHSVEYHRNPFLVREVQYLDYKFLSTWRDKLRELFLDQKSRIFIATNNKKMLRSLERFLKEELNRRAGEALAARRDDPESRWYIALAEDPAAIKIITGDIDGMTKTRMAEECNHQWSQSFVLGITPVVGAGISFDEMDFFHEAFLYASPSSACPRALNQLLGRVRYLKRNKVHVFIEETAMKTTERHMMQYQAAYSETKRRLYNNSNFQLSDLVAEERNGELLWRCVQPDKDLLEIAARNTMEQVAGEHDFRSEFIKVLQKTNPTVNYSFVLAGDYERDTRALLETRRGAQLNERVDIHHLSHRPELDHEQHREVKRRNDRGQMALDDPEEQEHVSVTIKKNDLKNQLGLQDNLDPAYYAAYWRYFEFKDEALEQVRTMCRLFFAAVRDLLLDCREELKPVHFALEAPGGGEAGQARAKERVSQDYDPLDFRVKHWLKTLLYIGGYEGFSEEPAPETEAVVLARLRGHSAVMRDNLDTEWCQAWLKKHLPGVREFAQIPVKVYKPRKPIKNPQEGQRQRQEDDVSPAAFSWTLKQFMRRLTGLEFVQAKREDKCALHGARCRVSQPDERDLRIRFSMSRQYLRYSRRAADWVQNAREACERVCEALDIGLLPGFLSASSEETLEMPLEDWVAYVDHLYTQAKERELSRVEMTRKRKKTEAEPLNARERFEQKWNDIVGTFVGANMYEETKPERFLASILSPGFKVRTKRNMKDALTCMREKLRILAEDQGG